MRYQPVAVSMPFSRMNGVRICLWNIIFKGIIVLMIVAPILYAGIRYMNAPQNSGRSMGHIQIPLTSLPEGKSKVVLYNGQPVIVVNNRGSIKALSALCTKGDSILDFDNKHEELFCSGARFDLNGNVKSGLAPRPLKTFKLMITEDTIILGDYL